MAYQKINHAIILTLIVLIFLGCRRTSKEYTVARWEIINPVTNAPYVGIPVRLILRHYKSNGPESEVIWEGETNSEGIAEYKFRAYKNNSFGYVEVANLSLLGTHGLDYAIIKRPAMSRYTVDKDEINDLRYEIVPYGEYVQHTKNIDCQGSEDKMRLRRKFLYSGKGENDFSNWFPNIGLNGFSHIEGCYENLSNNPIKIPSDSILFEIEVTRNGNVERFYKTFFVGSGYVDTVKIYY